MTAVVGVDTTVVDVGSPPLGGVPGQPPAPHPSNLESPFPA